MDSSTARAMKRAMVVNEAVVVKEANSSSNCNPKKCATAACHVLSIRVLHYRLRARLLHFLHFTFSVAQSLSFSLPHSVYFALPFGPVDFERRLVSFLHIILSLVHYSLTLSLSPDSLFLSVAPVSLFLSLSLSLSHSLILW